MRKLLLLMAFMAGPVRADVADAIKDQLTPGYDHFAAASADLAQASAGSCDPAVLRPLWNAAFDAWLGVSHFRMGPVEEDGRGMAIAFWPDPKGLGWKQQRALMAGDPGLLGPEVFAHQSVAARGLFALERLLYPAEKLASDPCPLIAATSADLARMASEVQAEFSAYADLVLTAGAAGNSAFLTEAEAKQALFTQLASALEFDADQRLGRPMGSFDKPRPERAEAVLSARSQRNLLLSLQALRRFADALSTNLPLSDAAFDRVIGLVETLDDPAFAGAGDPSGRLKLEIVQQNLSSLRQVVLAELGGQMGVDIGFNSADGD